MIKKVKKETITTAHYPLLYEADPAKKMVADFITRGICFDYLTEVLHRILVLLPTHPRTLEIVNIAVSE
ncbi:GNAT family N-acetyltransferase, partial [Enterococcus faecalis]